MCRDRKRVAVAWTEPRTGLEGTAVGAEWSRTGLWLQTSVNWLQIIECAQVKCMVCKFYLKAVKKTECGRGRGEREGEEGNQS